MSTDTDTPQTDTPQTDTDLEWSNPNAGHIIDQAIIRHTRFDRRKYIEALNLLDMLDEDMDNEGQE